jgi:hypothetical protein
MTAYGLLARTWVFDVLNSIPEVIEHTKTVSEHPAREGSKYPAVTVATASDFLPIQNVSELDLHAEGQLLIRVWVKSTDWELAETINNAISGPLTASNAPIEGGGWVLTSRFHKDHLAVEGDYRCLGGVYRLRVKAG